MSRYYRDPPPPTRWDADRFARERDYRDYREVDEYYAPAPPPQRRPARPVYEDERVYYEDDRYGPRGTRVERQYFEEEGYYDPRVQRGQMVPYRPARPPMPEAPPRPGLLRRQSSLDTFDRPPQRRYDDYDQYRPPPRPQRVNIDVPPEPSPRSNRYRPARPSRPAYREYDYDYGEYYDDVAIADPEYYGDDGFREYKEREWISRRRRSSSRSRSRSRPPTEVFKEKEEVKEEVKVDKKEIVRKEEIKEEIKEKPYPRRGKTKMPKRLVHTKVLFDLGYPFYEEGEKTLIIEKALGPDNIDEVFAKSREYFAKETSTTRLIEAPPPPPPSAPPSAVATSVKVSTRAPSVHESVHESVRESLRADLFESGGTKPLSEAPRSVREWDQLTVKEDDRKSVRSSRARSKSRRRSEVDRETVFEERKSTVLERSPSPSPERERRRRRRRSRRRASRASASSIDETEIIERKIITEEEGFFPIESESVHVGPLVMARDARNSRSERDIKAEIRRLEAEQRDLRRERGRDSAEFVKIERRVPSRSPSADTREVIIERQGDDVVEIRKDRRERSFSRTRAPSAGLIKAMFYTAT